MKDKVNKGTVWVITREYRDWDVDYTTVVEVWETEPPNEYLRKLEQGYDCKYTLNAEECDFYGIGGE